MNRYRIVIDLKKYFGFHTCVTSCRNTNSLPVSIWWSTIYSDVDTIITIAAGEYLNYTM